MSTNRGQPQEAWGVVLADSPVLLALRHAMPGLEYMIGMEVRHIRGWEVCT
ncbi:hypothetical protein [Kocuria soli]|uniref:hypothetical protein n=1 Tax=Kocuria soli TaxID=2485125 RepID=UPI001F45CAC5|nr:hypothetical protein [Kocuria soli]